MICYFNSTEVIAYKRDTTNTLVLLTEYDLGSFENKKALIPSMKVDEWINQKGLTKVDEIMSSDAYRIWWFIYYFLH